MQSTFLTLNSKDKMVCWGNGSPVRDFVSSFDVARAMLFCVENEIQELILSLPDCLYRTNLLTSFQETRVRRDWARWCNFP